MLPAEDAVSVRYTVRVAFVDDSYWDDGSRWTRRTFDFKSQKDAVSFANEALSKGLTIKGQCGEVRVRPNEDDITIERHSTVQVKWTSGSSK